MKDKFILANQCAVRVRDTERGENTVLLLHGYLESLDTWEDLTLILKRNCRVISLDLPGHGISEVKGEVHSMEFLADVAADVLCKAGVSSATIVGHSMGGYVALAFANRHKDMVDALVLLHSTPNADREEKRENRIREIKLIESGKKELLARLTPSVRFANCNRNRFSDVIEDMYEQVILTEDEGIIAIIKGMGLREDLNDMMLGLGRPELLILGTMDEYIPIEYAKSVVEKHPQAEVLWLENSGHMGHVEEPEVVAEAILRISNSL